MRTTKLDLCALAIGLVSLVGFTSCLSDDDNNNNNQYREMTALEKEIALSKAAGYYSGKFYFYNVENKLDSVATDVSITASDSLLTTKIPKEPLNAFIHQFSLPETTLAIFDQAPSPELKGVLHPYWNQYLEAYFYTFIYTYVNNTVTMSFNVDETPHTVIYKFKDILYGSYGEEYVCYAQWDNNAFACNVLLESIQLDDSLFPINACMSLSVKR